MHQTTTKMRVRHVLSLFLLRWTPHTGPEWNCLDQKVQKNFVNDGKIVTTLNFRLLNVSMVNISSVNKKIRDLLCKKFNFAIFLFLNFYSDMGFTNENWWKIIARPLKFYFLTQGAANVYQFSLSMWFLWKYYLK